jgi:ribosomal protein S26
LGKSRRETMICIKCSKELSKDSSAYVFELVKVVDYEIYEKISFKAVICVNCWKGEE